MNNIINSLLTNLIDFLSILISINFVQNYNLNLFLVLKRLKLQLLWWQHRFSAIFVSNLKSKGRSSLVKGHACLRWTWEHLTKLLWIWSAWFAAPNQTRIDQCGEGTERVDTPWYNGHLTSHPRYPGVIRLHLWSLLMISRIRFLFLFKCFLQVYDLCFSWTVLMNTNAAISRSVVV